MDLPSSELMSSLAHLLASGEHSDLTIVCGMKRYPLHRAIVCPRSEFITRTLRIGLEESRTGVINLRADDPELVEHMVHYFYHLDYLPECPRRSSHSSPRVASPCAPRPSVPQEFKKLNLALIEDPLVATATASEAMSPLTPSAVHATHSDAVDASTNKLPDILLAGLEESEPFVAVQGEHAADPETSPLLVHVQMYALAEKYVIAGLKSLARKKFIDRLEIEIQKKSSILPYAFAEIYESTVDTDRGLRGVVVQAFRAHPELALREDIVEMIRESPELRILGFELWQIDHGLPLETR